MLDLFDASGRQIPLGKKIGAGGEGAVFDVPIYGTDFVAKVYHQALPTHRQAKLLAMVECNTDSLRKIASWPVDALYTNLRGGAICGFIMPKVIGYEPIHHLYGPGHRKQQFPNADWGFLVNTARNVAAAFDVIHAHNHVIADVNQNNIVVARNSIVKLIDCDSFQITTASKNYLCEVGVGHFTPPELQGQSFHGVHRTRNHDNFGLAVLIFHLLLMGRHPYSGVYLGAEEMPVEKAIQEFRFAFGSNAGAKKMAPPPNSVLLNILPATISWLFERAFSEESAYSKYRPSAREWLTALDALKEQLQTCSQIASHQYFAELHECPWCKLEHKAKIFFFNTPRIASAIELEPSSFDLIKVWEAINQVPSPGTAPLINPSTFRAHPHPLPKSLKTPFAIFKSKKYHSELKRREAALEQARIVFAARVKKWRTEAGDEAFNKKFRELFYLRLEYERLVRDFEIERDQIQLRPHQHFVRLLRIIFKRKSPPGVNILKDYSSNNLAESNNYSDSNADNINLLVQRFQFRREQLEKALTEGVEQLQRLHEDVLLLRQDMYQLLVEAAQAVAQAEADLRIMRRS